jgi:thiosulfate dehydrogenase (quinone) large subunit
MTPHKNLVSLPISRWVLLPLRLFLGVTFVYAGIQKLTDPQFFQPTTVGYVGKQIAAFAINSPLHDFLLHTALPHALLFGYLIAFGEIAIGLATLAGLLLRPAALFGLLLSVIFFLTASWRVYPYFYGADIVFIFCWLTLLLNGPLNTGLPGLDERLAYFLFYRVAPQRRTRLARMLNVILGIPLTDSSSTNHAPNLEVAISPINSQTIKNTGAAQLKLRGNSRERQAQEKRRNFLQGFFVGGATVLGLTGITYALQSLMHALAPQDSTLPSAATSSSTDTATTAPTNTPSTPTSAGAIATVSAVPSNSAVNFTLPSSGDPGVLVHLQKGQFVAYSAVCTHAGCQVDYDPASHLLVCPCHGATFDPTQNGAVVDPPARIPLSPVAIHVDATTGAITLS